MTEDTRSTIDNRLPDIGREIMIEGHSFTVEPGDVEAVSIAQELATKLGAIDLTTVDEDTYRSLAADLVTAIDSILGKGATAKIFAGRRTNIILLAWVLKKTVEGTSSGFDAALETVLGDLTETAGEG
jgi:hypothetical protein